MLGRFHSRAWRDEVRDLERDGWVSDQALSRYWDRRGELIADLRSGGRWWERPWLHSLSQARGGVDPLRVHKVGVSRPILRAGPVSVSNDLRLRLGRLGVGVESSIQDVDASELQLRHDQLLAEEATDLLDPAERSGVALALSATAPLGRWLGLVWKFRVYPRVRARLSTRRFNGDFRLRCRFEASARSSGKRVRIGAIEGQVKYRLEDDEVSGLIVVRLLAW